jgi:hypothetical protein
MVVMSGGGDIQPLAYGIMFGIVAGMMVYIVIAHVSTQATCRCASDAWVFSDRLRRDYSCCRERTGTTRRTSSSPSAVPLEWYA